ncbi:uncharacterized protein Dana_GF24858, isoform B [Drosophila ananassae]|uniref:Uncharacterized protein, isoform B n=1 Tax=Drosophila ananassae TaxID=7217 RepID=A0A0P8ZSW5_DROAN|nr:uncharacterized protein Dana_GF24858, isoform B [Drosophila ananassae]
MMAAEPMTTDQPTGVGLEPQGPRHICRADDGDADSLSSLSDHLTVWVDGEEHWISGVDENTTCADLVWALLNYQNNPQSLRNPTWNQEYAIVQKLHHYEEYLDGGARLADVISKQHAPLADKCQLQLRHLGPASTGKHPATTDKDSGMGSPVESSRSIRFRRRGRHKTLPPARVSQLLEGEQWGEFGMRDHPKQPKRSRKLQVRNGPLAPNETLLTTILAQDETILQQMSMLHEKDRQIRKIEEEKHLVREREMGKNYLLETYLRDLEDPEENGPQVQDLEEGVMRLHQDRNHEIAEESACKDDGSVTDEMRLFWLEKIHAVNKQLQREEERLLSLHAKVRRHHVKRAYQSKSEVLQHIDRLDSELAAQVADILQVERKLFTANEQLKAKLGVLECLGREFETTVARNDQEPSPVTASEERSTKSIEPRSQHKETKNDLRVSAVGQPVLEDHLLIPSHIQCLTQSELTDKNLKDRHVPDKGLSKQLFMEEPSTSTNRPNRPEKCCAPALYSAGSDIQHLGTLV